jgi:hypothetical protein
MHDVAGYDAATRCSQVYSRYPTVIAICGLGFTTEELNPVVNECDGYGDGSDAYECFYDDLDDAHGLVQLSGL